MSLEKKDERRKFICCERNPQLNEDSYKTGLHLVDFRACKISTWMDSKGTARSPKLPHASTPRIFANAGTVEAAV